MAVARIVRIGPAPEVRRVADVGERTLVDGQALFRRADNERGPPRRGGVLQCVAGPALRGVHADRQDIAPHAGADDAHARDDGLAARLARKLQVCGLDVGRCADGFRHDGGGGLHGVWMRLAAHPHGAQLLRVDPGPRQRVARSLDGHRERVFIQPGNGFLFNRQTAGAIRPDPRDFGRGQAVAWDIGPVTDDSDILNRFQHGVSLLNHAISPGCIRTS